ncbi:MAG: Cof-type HAD-IIB family hydrolase [Anaerolineae bacterium]|nr:Cof-type HAD-IIB family hydrolase [Anaerolineae bacterium]
MSIQLIAVDLDGTLLNSQHQLTPRTRAALQAAVRQGIQVVVATGRTRSAPTAGRVIEELGLTSPGIFSQGLMIHNADGSVRFQQSISTERAAEVIRFSEANRLHYYGASGATLFMQPDNPFVVAMLEQYHEPSPREVPSLLHILDSHPINKFVFIEAPERLTDLRDFLLPQLVDGENLFASAPEFLEFVPAGASKGAALARLIEELNIPRESVLALGDAENDIEMLQVAGIGVAMGNAMPHVKEIADYITLSNDEDGVAEAIERFVLTR